MSGDQILAVLKSGLRVCGIGSLPCYVPDLRYGCEKTAHTTHVSVHLYLHVPALRGACLPLCQAQHSVRANLFPSSAMVVVSLAGRYCLLDQKACRRHHHWRCFVVHFLKATCHNTGPLGIRTYEQILDLVGARLHISCTRCVCFLASSSCLRGFWRLPVCSVGCCFGSVLATSSSCSCSSLYPFRLDSLFSRFVSFVVLSLEDFFASVLRLVGPGIHQSACTCPCATPACAPFRKTAST